MFFDNYFLNVNFSITKAHTYFEFILPSLHTHFEGTVSQMSYQGPGFYFLAKIGKHLINCVNIFLLSDIKQNLGPE